MFYCAIVDEVRKLLGTDKEKTILAPDTNKYYNGLGQRCVTEYGSGVELFLFPPINGNLWNGPYLLYVLINVKSAH